MKRTLIALSFALAFFATSAVVHAQYNIPGFTLKNNSQCVGGTLILEFGDVQDTGAAVSAKPLATLDCQYFMTGPDQCCSVKYRRATPAPPAIGSHVFLYEIYQGGTVGPSVPPAGTFTSSFQHWAGGSSAPTCAVPGGLTQNQPSQAQHTDAEVIADSGVKADVFRPGSFSEGDLRNIGRNGIATRWYLSGDQVSMNRVCSVLHGTGSTASNITRADMASASNVVKIASVYYDGSKWLEIGSRGLVAGDTYLTGSFSCSTTAVTGGETCTPPTPVAVTASLIANPNSIFEGEQALLSWSSTGATECTGSKFSTGGADSGSTIVTPDETTQYSVTCTGAGGTATANATVTVVGVVDPPGVSVTCRAHPSNVAIGEDVLWSSTVTGPAGSYTYTWGGTDGLSGSGNQVFKKYTSSGSKNGQLTVTYTPVQAATAPPPAASASPATGAVTPPPTEIAPGSGAACPALGWVTPVTPCAGLWAPTYGTGGCQTGWQCTVTTGGGSGGGIEPESPGVFEGLLDFFRFSEPTINAIPDVQTVDGSVLSAQSVTVQCENSVSVRLPQCSDGVDNNGDGNSDYPSDPGCTSDDDDDETSEDDDDAPQCSDGVDNDGDGDIDAADPGCNIGSGGGGGGGGSYNPNDNSESGAGGAGSPQCSDNEDNNGDGNIDFPDDPGCSSPDDNLELAQPADVTFTADPPLVKKNQSCTLTLSARSVSSCSLSGPGLSRSFTAVGGLISLKEVVTPTLAQSSTFTLSCNGLDGKRTSKSVDCKIAPTFEEF